MSVFASGNPHRRLAASNGQPSRSGATSEFLQPRRAQLHPADGCLICQNQSGPREYDFLRRRRRWWCRRWWWWRRRWWRGSGFLSPITREGTAHEPAYNGTHWNQDLVRSRVAIASSDGACRETAIRESTDSNADKAGPLGLRRHRRATRDRGSHNYIGYPSGCSR
jgi:hypothetical protein